MMDILISFYPVPYQTGKRQKFGAPNPVVVEISPGPASTAQTKWE